MLLVWLFLFIYTLLPCYFLLVSISISVIFCWLFIKYIIHNVKSCIFGNHNLNKSMHFFLYKLQESNCLSFFCQPRNRMICLNLRFALDNSSCNTHIYIVKQNICTLFYTWKCLRIFLVIIVIILYYYLHHRNCAPSFLYLRDWTILKDCHSGNSFLLLTLE